MKFYRVRYCCHDDESGATVDWFTTKRAAEREHRDGGFHSTLDVIDVPTDKAGLLQFLNRYAT
jgi:hypothetical protein